MVQFIDDRCRMQLNKSFKVWNGLTSLGHDFAFKWLIQLHAGCGFCCLRVHLITNWFPPKLRPETDWQVWVIGFGCLKIDSSSCWIRILLPTGFLNYKLITTKVYCIVPFLTRDWHGTFIMLYHANSKQWHVKSH